MAAPKVTVRLAIKEALPGMITNAVKSDIATVVIGMAKRMIATGQSPVRGVGRFEAYKAAANAQAIKAALPKAAKGKVGKNIRASNKIARAKADTKAKKGYPYSVMDKFPNKKVRPVNLELSGGMLDDLKWSPGKGTGTLIGISERLGSSTLHRKMAETHNAGTQSGRVPKRQFLPEDDQTFAVTIIDRIKTIVSDRLLAIIKKTNGR